MPLTKGARLSYLRARVGGDAGSQVVCALHLPEQLLHIIAGDPVPPAAAGAADDGQSRGYVAQLPTETQTDTSPVGLNVS